MHGLLLIICQIILLQSYLYKVWGILFRLSEEVCQRTQKEMGNNNSANNHEIRRIGDWSPDIEIEQILENSNDVTPSVMQQIREDHAKEHGLD